MAKKRQSEQSPTSQELISKGADASRHLLAAVEEPAGPGVPRRPGLLLLSLFLLLAWLAILVGLAIWG